MKSTSNQIRLRVLGSNDTALMKNVLSLFGEAFDDVERYSSNPPSADYLCGLLASDQFVVVAATIGDEVVGGLTVYILRKFEQERSEFYIYDLAVAEAHRRKGIATALIKELQRVALERGAYVIFVQAHVGDDPAIALYTTLGERAEVLHFDFPVNAETQEG